ncbi:Aldolase-type TIM barrel [Penicillium waksmanii]|uniref:Aldolase-type TIM barrel n=1 Tax=Penicillium waksmanii TaxID=69791 RepID=UPI002548BD20|nr:Aldolase-type TIM barrel [Penicillium waksmanii]KAJ5988503.1 Aldolase-type TIM barrel [Penicillium waksmanii]
MPSPLSDPVKLPCGLVLPNRLSKAAMAEMMAKSHHPDPLYEAYEKWSTGGWGSILTGNVQVDINHLGSPFDPALDGEYTGKRGIFANTIAPSAVPISIGDSWLECFIGAVAWTKPRAMSTAEVQRVISQFVDTARLMADAGFSGIELHGAHGYLIDQFLSSKTNLRTDEFGGTPEKRARFVLEIIKQTRAIVPQTFAIGIKLNSADHSSATFEETMTQIALLVEAGIDFMEISGGTYEDPQMMGYPKAEIPVKSERTAAREAFFLEFAKTVRGRHPELILMLTGGFRTRAGCVAAIEDGACDLVGIGRPAAVEPAFPLLLLDEGVKDDKAGLPLIKVPPPWYMRFLPRNLIGAGAESTYYAAQIQRFARGLATYAPAL